MPVGFNSPARNLFLLGSSGAQVLTNFFKTIDQSAGTDGVYLPDEIKYNFVDQKFVLAGSAEDSNSKGFGWFEKRNDAGTADFQNRIEAPQVGVNTTLRAMELDANDNLIVVGKTADIPWIAKYSNGGVISWQSTTNSGDVEYTGITSDANGNYYACGSTPELGATNQAQAFVEKFDTNGNPGWGKSAFMLGRDVVLSKIAANTKGEVVAVGYLEDDSADKGYIVKIDTNTGEVLWDRTLSVSTENNSGFRHNVWCQDVFIDSNDQIYIVGRIGDASSVRSFIAKYTEEGNLVWQKETPAEEKIDFYGVKSDGETEQTVVFGMYYDTTANDRRGILSKYSKNGDLVWRRILFSSDTVIVSNNFGQTSGGGRPQGGYISLDADPSFYYFLFIDNSISGFSGFPDAYTFGKVSSSGNGLGAFQYQSGTGETYNYEILNIQDKIGRLSDGSVRQDSSDLITYPFSANKILFDDLATQVSNKKRQMDTADSFEYSGSPAIRPADFQELNLLGDVYSGSGNWLDQSGKGNDGVVNGATHNLAGYWEFDGTDDYIEISNFSGFSGGNNPFTVSLWLNTDHGGTDADEHVFFYGNEATGEAIRIRLYADGGIEVGHWGGAGYDWGTSAGAYNLNEWSMITETYDGTTDRIYVNGVEVANDSSLNSLNIPTQAILYIGRRISNRYYSGKVGEVRIYDRALTPAQVFQNYNATKTKYINEAPDIAPKISNSPIVYDNSLLLNYDFGNQATYDTRQLTVTPPASISSTEQKIIASDGAADDRFGYSVAVGSNRIVVGAYQDDDKENNSGSAYIFDLNGNQLAKITASDGAADDRFGFSVAVGHDKIVVGAYSDDDNGTNSGAIYIYDLDGTNEVKVTASDAAANDFFGYSVAVGSNKIVVGAWGYSPSVGYTPGAAYVYDLDGTNEIKITASDGASNDRFGQAVAVGSNKIVIGANQDDDNSGSAYIYDLDGTNEIKITAPDVVSDNYFGRAVAVGSNKIVVGAYYDDTDTVNNCGAAYIFDLDGTNVVKITASDAAFFDFFGWAVAVASNRIVVGALYKEAAYIFDLNGNELAKITASDAAANNSFGFSVAAGDNKILVGAYLDDAGSGSGSGSAYIYSLSSPPTTVKNLSSSSYTGTINGPTFNSAGYFEHDGTSQSAGSIFATNSGLPTGLSPRTMEAWVYMNSLGAGNNPAFLAYGNDAAGEQSGLRYVGTGLQVSFWTATYDFNTGFNPGLNVWFHYVATYNTNNVIEAYVNGVSIGTKDLSATPLNTVLGANLMLFRLNEPPSGPNYYPHDGRIGEARIYNRALTATEVSQNFNATRGKYGV